MNPRLKNLAPSLIRQVHSKKRETSIDLSLGEPSVRVDQELLARAERRFAGMPQGYTANLGMKPLREAVAAYHRYPGKHSADNVAITVGSQHALFCVFSSLLAPGDEVVILDPSYPAYASLALVCAATPKAVPLSNSFRWSAGQIVAAFTDKTRLVVLSSPSNPLGFIDDPSELKILVAEAEARGITIVSDEVYRELYLSRAPVSPATLSESVVVVGGLSKACAMTGYRLGYVLASASLVTAIWPLLQLTVTCAPTFAQCLGLEAFLEPRFLHAHRPMYQERWAKAEHSLRANRIEYLTPDGAFYVVCRTVPEGGDPLAYCLKTLDERDVVTVPGTAFGRALSRYVRLSFAGEPEAFAQGVARLV